MQLWQPAVSVALLASLLFVCVPTRTHDKKQNYARVGGKQQSWLFIFMWRFISTFLSGGRRAKHTCLLLQGSSKKKSWISARRCMWEQTSCSVFGPKTPWIFSLGLTFPTDGPRYTPWYPKVEHTWSLVPPFSVNIRFHGKYLALALSPVAGSYQSRYYGCLCYS